MSAAESRTTQVSSFYIASNYIISLLNLKCFTKYMVVNVGDFVAIITRLTILIHTLYICVKLFLKIQSILATFHCWQVSLERSQASGWLWDNDYPQLYQVKIVAQRLIEFKISLNSMSATVDVAACSENGSDDRA